jgi:iron complex transport system substrate-binding protein
MTKRLLALLAALLLALSACGSDDGGDDEASASEAAEADDSGFPLTIEHKYGETTIEDRPERVVSVGFTDQDAILALGVVPVGIRDWYGEQPNAVWPWAQDELGGEEPVVLAATEINLEAVAALEPDVILGLSSGMTEAEYADLSEIAPTVTQSADFVDYGMPWQEATITIGEVLGEAERAQELVEETEALIAEVAECHPEFEGAEGVVAYHYGEGKIGAYAPADVRSRLLTSLGFEIPAAVTERAGDQFYTDFSTENIDLVDVDVLVWISSGAEAQYVVDEPLRPQLQAFREGREILASDPVLAGAWSFSSVLSLPFVLEELEPKLVAAIDGDPATPVP